MLYDGAPLDMKRFTQMYVTVSALPVILLLLTFVLWFMMDTQSASAEPEVVAIPALQWALFSLMALASLPGAVWLRAFTLRQSGDFTGSKSRWSATQTFSGTDAAIMRIMSAAVVGMAMPEISLLLGFVLGFMTMSWAPYLPFAAYTTLGWIIMYPRPSQVRAWYARQTGAEPVPSIIS